MEHISINDLKKSHYFRQNIRWDVTPKIFLSPSIPSGNKAEGIVDATHGYMLYVDIVNDKPALVIMQLKYAMSRTVGYVDDIPEDLLREAMNCNAEEHKTGMCPLPKSLQEWLKKEMELSC